MRLIYTQNLAAVLSDPKRTRSEVSAFFTRHWGEQFIPRKNIPPAQTIPSISLEHFRQYLATTAKKHKQYLKARRALRQKQTQQNGEEERISRDEVADIFFSPTFSRHTQHTFEAVFLEPKPGEIDNLFSPIEKRKEALRQQQNQNPFIERHESCGSLYSIQSGQQQQSLLPIEASNGRFFRACLRLQNKLEFFDDAISTLLNQQLENRSEQFWKSVNSYEALHDDLEESIERIKIARQKLAKTKLELCSRSQNLLQLYYAKINRQRLFDKLQEIACLRDAQLTVQMLLNQDDVPRALECIQTAMEVLSADLRAVNCFRHLGSQLEETKKMIGKMLLEEFEQVIQKEFAWPIEEQKRKQFFDEEEEEDDGEISNLYPIIFSLVRCHEFRFLAILREEINATVKNSTKQIVKAQILTHLDADTIGYNPTTLSEHICKLTSPQWDATLLAVVNCLIILCNKMKSIQQLIIKCADQAALEESEQLQKQQQQKSRSDSINKSSAQNSGTSTPSIGNSSVGSSSIPLDKTTTNPPPLPPGTPGALLSLPCHNINQLRAAAIQLIGHAIYLCEERISKRIQSRFKTNKFISKFTEARQRELSATIDAEPWKLAHINSNIQRIVDCYVQDGVLTTATNNEMINNGEDEEPKEMLKLKDEEFIVIGSALLLINILASYSDLLRLFPTAGMELSMDVVQCLKLFNSRTCQLILGAALASRSLQLISIFIPALKQSFLEHLPVERQTSLRHFDSTARDYADHIGEIKDKLLGMMDRELLVALEEV
uniref:Vacuolar protein sorting-associated protein 54 n=2 Tax=Meloidogyne TaxID=189290 RepID=A0A915NQD0_9BILA